MRAISVPACAAACGAVLAASAGAGGGAVEVSCQFDRDAHELNVAPGIPGGGPGQTPFVSIGREGKAIVVRELGNGRAERRECEGGRATVTNTDRIHIGTPVRVADVLVVVDLSGGLLEPGATSARGTGIKIEAYTGEKGRFRLVGSEGRDRWVFGARDKPSEAVLVNFDSGESKREWDLLIGLEPRELATDLGGGNDRFSGAGGSGTGGAMSAGFELGGGSGRDLIIGGRGDDVLSGGDGDDVLMGEDGSDRLDLTGGAGADRLDCGPGRDRFGHDDADRVRHC